MMRFGLPFVVRRSWKAGFLLPLAFLAATAPAIAQVAAPGACTVSVLNQSAFVQEDGSWRLFNVPANMGSVRARINCVQNGQTLSGTSELFAMATGKMSSILPVPLGDPAPAPVRIAIAPPSGPLGAAGQTLQLAVTAFYADGSTRSVTPESEGTVYRSTNPRVATVSADGLVRAVASGRVLVTALHEAILASAFVDVVASGDSDGDGLADDLELANGLDPNDPVDALGDLDGDGLTNARELQVTGTDIRKGDTDDDGLRDGEELSRYGTNPLLFDSDGDEVSDGLEVRTGSDPLDPASANLATILTGLTVTPGSFTLIYNTVLGEASRRLEVRGTLVDGRTIDLRRRSRGTSYLSGDLTVASFGTEDGRVFAGRNGVTTVTVSNNGRTATAQVAVSSFAPVALSYLAIAGSANGVDVSGAYAYVAAGSAGLAVVDVSDPQTPRLHGAVDTPGNANDVRVDAGFAYVADGAAGLTVVDVRNPAAPAVVGRRDTPGVAADLAVRGGRAYVADGEGGLVIIDVREPSVPVTLGSLDTPGEANGVDADGTLAVVADGLSGLQVVDVRDPANPVLLGTTSTRPNFVSHAADVVLRGRFAYVADGAGVSLGGVRTIDLQDPANPVVVASSDDGFGLTALALDGRLALAADYFFPNTVPIFEISGTPISFAERLDFDPPFLDADGNGIAVQDGVAYLAATQGIAENAESAPGGLFIGRYLLRQDTEGIAPRVSLVRPLAGSTAPERSPLVVQAEASDDLMVAAVQFLIDGVPFFDDTKPPFEAVLPVPAGVASFTLSAVATDFGGNRGTAEPVTVSVVPDQNPRVSLLAPVPGQSFSEGVAIELAASASDDVRIDGVEFFLDGISAGVVTSPPYRLAVLIPLGSTQLAVHAVATDSGGQTATSDTVTVAVTDDPPPIVTLLAPQAGRELIVGSRIAVDVGAADQQAVSSVRLSVNGEPARERTESPYRFFFVVPAGAELVLTATAEDSVGQTATVEARYPLIPDPGTTVSGRVVDDLGAGVAGASVRCFGVSAVTLAGGAFSIPAVATVRGPFTCGAAGVDRFGEAAEGRSGLVTPVPGGTTPVGDVAIRPQRLYVASGNGFEPLAAGRLWVLDPASDHYDPWSRAVAPQGLSGLAFDGAGQLYATTLVQENVQPTFAPATFPGAAPAKAVFLSPGSRLLRLDPESGEILSSLPVELADGSGGGAGAAARPSAKAFGSIPLAVRSLAYVPSTGRLYALAQDQPSLYSIDPATGAATLVTGNLRSPFARLAAGPDGLLYLLYREAGETVSTLSSLDPESGAVVQAVTVAGNVDAGGGGMALRPGAGTFVLSSGFGGSEILDASGDTTLVELDPETLTVEPYRSPTGALDSELLGLSYRAIPSAETVSTTVSGRVVDGGGFIVLDADVSAPGAFGTSGANGRFTLPGVGVRGGTVRVAARLDELLSFSPAVPVVPNGTTDVGTIQLGAPVCVTGTIRENRCSQGPVSVPLDLRVQEFEDALVGQVVPDESGRFCIDVRPGLTYLLRKEDLACSCGGTAFCDARFAVTDPDASGACGLPGAACQDLGELTMDCDFFCGS